jgi:hypothetical protein
LAVGTTAGAGALVNFNGSTQGTSMNQMLDGTGTFEGNGANGIIRALFFQTTGTCTINTTQNLTTTSFAHTAGNLNTNNKLTIDNAVQVFGRPINNQVSSIALTTMGTYTNEPVVFGATCSLWVANAAAVLNTRYFSGNNVYVATTAGTFDASVAPTHTSGIVANGTAQLLWIGTLGTLGNPFQQTSVSVGTQYFYGNNLYVCTVGGVPSANAPPVHTSGSAVSGAATFLYVGSPAVASVNYNSSATPNLRSVNLVNAGSGYSSSPSIVFSANGGTVTTAAVATATYFQSIAYFTNSQSQTSGAATVNGTININSNQNATSFSGVGSVFTTNGGVNYTIAPTVGFSGPTAINLVTDGGSGYAAAPTVTVTGGTLVSGTALSSSNFTVTVAGGKVVSVYLTGTATYSVPPTLAFSAGNATLEFPAGCWATATPIIGANGQISNFTITNAGFGYSVAPTVGFGSTSGTALGGTYTTAATTPTARVALYNAILGFFGPAATNVQNTMAAIIPANGKLNAITMNSASGAMFATNLELFASAPLTLTTGILDLGSNTITFKNTGYAGTAGTATSHVKASAITLSSIGGSLTRTFPLPAAVVIATGTGSLATGSTITSLTTTVTAAPTGSTSGGGANANGTRGYRIQTNANAVYGTAPTITLNYNATDALTATTNPDLFIGQSASLTGPWTIRSLASGTGALSATGSRTTATTGVGPFVGTGDDYFSWLASQNCTGTPVTGVISTTSSNVCVGSSVTFTSSVYTIAAGVTYRWQTSTDNTNWTDATGTSAGTFSLPISDSVWVRRVDTCSFSSAFSISNVVYISISAPLSSLVENFDGLTVPALPSCWYKVGTTGSVSTQTTGNFSAPNCLYIYSSSASNIVILGLPKLAGTDQGTHRLRFKARANLTAGGVVEVGYLTNPADQASFVVLGSVTTTSTTTYDDFELSPVNTPAGVNTLALRHTSIPSYSVLIDNVVYEPIPACNEPTNVAFSNLSSTGVDVSWDAPTAGTAPLSYSIYYSTTNTAPALTAAPTISGVVSPNITLSGLTTATPYYIWVRSKCSLTDSSSWSSVKTFTTLCESVTTYPYSQGFNTVGQLPACFVASSLTGSPANWDIVAADATHGAGSPAEGAAFARMDYYNATTGYNPYILTSIPFNLGTQAKRMKFSIWMGANSGTNSLALEISTDAGASWTLVETYTANSANTVATAPWESKIVDLSSYSNQVIQFRLNATSNWGTSFCNIGFDNLVVENIPSCNEPTNVLVSNLTSSGLDLAWDAPTAGASPISYSVYYSTTNTAPTLTTAPTKFGINGPATTLTGLTPATGYYIWVRSICSASDSSSWSPVKFVTTLCTTVTSFTQNFDALTVPALPTCWLKVGTTGTVNTQSTGAFTSPNALYIYSSSASNIAMVSMPPVSNGDAGTHRLRFRAKSNGTVGGIIEAGYLTDPLDQATFVSLGSFTTTSTTVYNDFQIAPINTPPGVTTLAFRHTGSPANSVLIDNVDYELIPSCNEPTNVQAANVTTNTADISWDAPTAGNSPISYSVYYSTSSVAPTLTAAPTQAGISGPNVNLTGLIPSSNYFIWVRSKCSPTDSSGWSNLKSFTTLCDVITSLPWTEGFEGVTAPAALILPNCWGYERTTGTNGPGTTTTNDTYRGPRTGTTYMYSQWSTTAWMFTPSFQLTAGTSYDFSFYMMNKNGTAGFTMDVAYGSTATDAGMTNVLQTAYPADNTSYNQFKYSFTPSATGVYYFGVKSTAPTSTPWYLSFDDFKLEASPSCNEPTGVTASNITTTTADVSWTAPSTGTSPLSYSVYYSTSATPPTQTSAPTRAGITGTSIGLTGLTSSTTYNIWVRSKCSLTDSSSWTPVYTFATQCDIVNTFPFAEGFNNATMPACWTQQAISGTAIWSTVTTNGNSTISPLTGARMAEFRTSTAGDKAKLISPRLDITGLTTPRLKFSFANVNWVGDIDELRVFYKTSAGGSWTQIGPDYITENATWATVVLELPNPSNDYYVAFEATSNWARGLDLDDVVIGNESAVPVSITLFKGEKKGNINSLTWTTSTEVNNAGFELQRSIDGVNFAPLGYVNSKANNGNSTQQLTYNFNDVRPLLSTGYYRLKQIDKDGKFNYSSIVILRSDKKGDLIVGNMYPNPVLNILNLSIESIKNTKVEIVVVNTLGMRVHQQTANLTSGINIQTMNISKLAAGLYHVQIIAPTGEVIHAGKVNKQ